MTNTELLWHVDEHDQPLGSVERATAHEQGFIHRAVLVVLTDNDGKYILQKRASTKKQYPDHWTVAASGHVTYGESYEEAAARETSEEIQVAAGALQLAEVLLVPSAEETQQVGVVMATLSALETMSADPEEVADIIAVTKEELKVLLQTEQFTPAARAVLGKLVAEE